MTTKNKTTWRRIKLGNVCPVVFSGGTPDTRISSYWRGSLPWLSSGETSQTYITKTEQHISEEAVKNSSTRLAKQEDVVIATAGQGHTRGQTSILKIDTYINQSIIALRPNQKELDPYYLFYNLRLRYPELRSLSDSTSSRGSITGPLMKDFELMLPSINTQKRIAAILSAFDDKIELNNKISRTLEQMAQAIFKEWFVKFRFPGHEKVKMVDSELGKIPEGWEVKLVKNLVKRLQQGKTYRPEELKQNGKVPVYDQSSGIILGYHDDIPALAANIDNPIVIFGDHTCRMRLVINPCSLGPNVVPFIGSKYPTSYVYYLTKGGIVQREYKRHWTEYEQKEYVVPPIEHAVRFKGVIRPLIEKIMKIESENQRLAAFRDLLLPKLMNGEVAI